MNQDLQNALAFYEPAPSDAYSGIEGKRLWLWEVLQGDFHENPSTAQSVTGTLLFMIPIVDQLGDVRDLVANCRKINKDSSDTWSWVALVLTLVGLFPTLGSLLKGCLKVLVLHVRKYIFKTLKPLPRIDAAALDQAMLLLSRHLDNPVVRKVLASMKIYNPYQYLAGKLSELNKSLTVSGLLARLDELMQVARQLFDSVMRFGPEALRGRVDRAWTSIVDVRKKADEGLANALRPAQDYIDQVINRLRVEGDNAYRARPGNNTHVLGNRQDAELELIKREKPEWVSIGEGSKYPALEKFPSDALIYVEKGWPDISATSKHPALKSKFNTFDNSMRAAEAVHGERLYRVVEPGARSFDNGGYWMRESEFQRLTSKGEWRRNFAVWKNWNENGEYLVYTIPPGKPLKVWEGRAATQKLESAEAYKLEGGREQLLLDPNDLKPEFTSPRQSTGWGYDDNTGDSQLDPLKPYLGLPELTHNWFE